VSLGLVEFTTIYRKYGPDVFRFAMYLCANQAEAEDIASETFVRLWTSPTPIVAATVKAYLFTIARNLHARRHQRDAGQVPLDDQLGDPGADATRRAEYRETRLALRQALAALSDIDRAAVLMRADGVSYEDIGAALGLSVAAARVKVHRARRALVGIR
jgi:RNA polymerase sigma factor (sigma-70 family)